MFFQSIKIKLKEKRVLIPFFASILLIFATVIFCFVFFLPKTEKIEEILVPVEPTSAPDITVDIKGNVVNPGVYTLPADSRVQDAVAIAGGFLSEQDRERTNLAYPLKDGEMITIGQIKININTADQAELETLPEIGETLAERIILYREQHSGFSNIEEIMYVQGIGAGKFEAIKEYITI